MRRRFSRGTAGPSWPTSARCNSASRLPSTTCPPPLAANWEAPNDGPSRGFQHHPAVAGGPAAVAHTRAHRGRSGDRGERRRLLRRRADAVLPLLSLVVYFHHRPHHRPAGVAHAAIRHRRRLGPGAVSYTHLTLPTKRI